MRRGGLTLIVLAVAAGTARAQGDPGSTSGAPAAAAPADGEPASVPPADDPGRAPPPPSPQQTPVPTPETPTPAVPATLPPAVAFEPTPHRVSLTFEALHLFVPVLALKAELALPANFGVALQGGYGHHTSHLNCDSETNAFLLGAQGTYYFKTNFDDGFMIGVDAHLSHVETPTSSDPTCMPGKPKFFSLGDGGAVGPFVGYKHIYTPGFTLEVQGGLQGTFGEATDPRILHLALGLGWSFGGERAPREAQPPAPSLDPLDRHTGFLVQFHLGAGILDLKGCTDCDTHAGFGGGGAVGWFLHRRFAVMIDATATTSLALGRFASVGMGLWSVAGQFWPHRSLWLKLGVGLARVISANALGGVEDNGAGGLIAAGFEFYRGQHLVADLQIRIVNASFDTDPTTNATNKQVDIGSAGGFIGLNWY